MSTATNGAATETAFKAIGTATKDAGSTVSQSAANYPNAARDLSRK